MSIIKDLFHGNISSQFMPLTEQSDNVTQKIIECQYRMRELIGDEEKAQELILDLEAANGKYNSIRSEECFEFGFFFGAHLMMEIFQQDII